jgi:hypothetical protein
VVPLFRRIAQCLNSSHFQVKFLLWILIWKTAYCSYKFI